MTPLRFRLRAARSASLSESVISCSGVGFSPPRRTNQPAAASRKTSAAPSPIHDERLMISLRRPLYLLGPAAALLSLAQPPQGLTQRLDLAPVRLEIALLQR